MKQSVKSKLLEVLDLAKDIVKGGPGSGPRPGGGRGSTSADGPKRSEEAQRATDKTGHQEAMKIAKQAVEFAKQGKHKEAAEAHDRAFKIHDWMHTDPKLTREQRLLHGAARASHARAATTHEVLAEG